MPSYTAQPLSVGPVPPTDDPAQTGPDPTGQKPHGYYRDCFFGTLAPIRRDIEWNGHRNTVSLRILEADEARQCAHFAYVRSEGHTDGDEYLQARVIFQIALCLHAVDDVLVETECRTLEQRLQLAAELPDTLQDALIAAYDEARYEPIAFLREMAEDAANFDQPPGGNGSSSAQVVSPQAV